jgi:hypothetical protein
MQTRRRKLEKRARRLAGEVTVTYFCICDQDSSNCQAAEHPKRSPKNESSHHDLTR